MKLVDILRSLPIHQPTRLKRPGDSRILEVMHIERLEYDRETRRHELKTWFDMSPYWHLMDIDADDWEHAL